MMNGTCSGNNAREALIDLFKRAGVFTHHAWAADVFLADLWVHGFKIVPLTAEDIAASQPNPREVQ